MNDIKFKIVSNLNEKARMYYSYSKTRKTVQDKKMMEQKADVYLDCVGIVKKIFEDYEK